MRGCLQGWHGVDLLRLGLPLRPSPLPLSESTRETLLRGLVPIGAVAANAVAVLATAVAKPAGSISAVPELVSDTVGKDAETVVDVVVSLTSLPATAE